MKNFILFISYLLPLISYGYFQQEVNYKISVKLDDQNHFLHAGIEIEYHNKSQEYLEYIWMHLWPNAYKNNSTALAKQLTERGSTRFYFSEDKDRGYIDSLNFMVDGTEAKWEYHPEHIDIAKVYLPQKLKPGGKIIITTPFRVKLPVGKFSRLGHIGQQYQVTQWYPKPAVYDLEGWHEMPYLDQGEFYSEFGSYEVKITVPKNYVVGATGDLQELSEIAWLGSLIKKTETITEYKKDNSFPESSKTWKTITFKQDKVHDFAWFADKRYHVKRGEVELPYSKRKVTTYVMYTNRNAKLWAKAIDYVNDAIYYYSKWNGEYPYNHCTAVDGALSAGGGMEYPNITVIGNMNSGKSLENVIMHEVGHNWFYGILGSNEREYPWMDEGINTYNEIKYMNMKYPSDLSDEKLLKFIGFNKKDHFDLNLLGYLYTARLNTDQSINTSSTDFTPTNYGLIAYFKTGAMFFYLEDFYGREKMEKAMKYYFEQWQFKHPRPEDLQQCLEESLGEDLGWFFEGLINSRGKLDYKYIRKKKTENGLKILVRNRSEIPAPFFLANEVDSSLIGIKGFTDSKWLEVTNDKNYKIGTRCLPDVYPLNNRSFWDKKLEVKMLSRVEDPSKNSIYLLPIYGWNNYNKNMLGLSVHNIGVPHKRFEYAITPMFSLAGENQSGAVLGAAEINYRILPQNIFRQILLRSSYSGFGLPSTNPYDEAGFLNLNNTVIFDIAPKSPNVGRSSGFELNTHYIEESYFKNEVGSIVNKNLFVSGRYFHAITKGINQFTSIGNFECHEDFLKVYTHFEFDHQYHRRSHMKIRFFAGAFVFNNSSNPRYNWRMDGRSGTNDYLYNEIFPDRGGHVTFLGKQFIDSEGAFKVPTEVGQSNNWLSSLNLKIEAPIKMPLPPFGLFADLGIYPDKNSSQVDFLYDAGFYISPLLGDFFSIYVPLTYSKAIDGYLSENNIGFGDQIRFTFKLKSLNPIKLRELVALQ